MNLRSITRIILVVIMSSALLAGCSNPDQEGFPFMFGPTKMFDPVNQPAGSGSNDVAIIVKDADGYTIYDSRVDIGGTIKTTDYSADFYGLPSGRHLVKVTHNDYEDKITIINLPGDGEEIEFIVTLQSNNDGGYGDPVTDDYEPNDSIHEPYNIEHENDSFDQSFNAVIGSPEDKDFYAFEVPDLHKIDVNLESIPSGCDYSINLYKLSDVDPCVTSSIDDNGNMDESLLWYTGLGNADWYYLEVYSQDSSNYSTDQQYHLTISVYPD